MRMAIAMAAVMMMAMFMVAKIVMVMVVMVMINVVTAGRPFSTPIAYWVRAMIHLGCRAVLATFGGLILNIHCSGSGIFTTRYCTLGPIGW